MEMESFENQLRQFLRREPFQPFVVELLDGQVVAINEPNLVMGGGGAAFISPDYELVEFACENVEAIRPAASTTTS